jgi:hypothetical protein
MSQILPGRIVASRRTEFPRAADAQTWPHALSSPTSDEEQAHRPRLPPSLHASRPPSPLHRHALDSFDVLPPPGPPQINTNSSCVRQGRQINTNPSGLHITGDVEPPPGSQLSETFRIVGLVEPPPGSELSETFRIVGLVMCRPGGFVLIWRPWCTQDEFVLIWGGPGGGRTSKLSSAWRCSGDGRSCQVRGDAVGMAADSRAAMAEDVAGVPAPRPRSAKKEREGTLCDERQRFGREELATCFANF